MSAIGAKWAVRRYSPTLYSVDNSVPISMSPSGRHEQTFDDWRDVCLAADTILGDHDLQIGMPPTDPVVIKHGDDVVLIYMKLLI